MRLLASSVLLIAACSSGPQRTSQGGATPAGTAPDRAPSDGAPAAPTTAVAASSSSTSSPAAAPPPPTIEAQLASLGFAKLPDPPTPDATRALAAGKKALAKHDLDQARARLGDALARSPALDEARYLLAVIDVRTGALTAACEALDRLASEDLYQFAPRIDGDPELAALRASPDGERLRQRIADLTALWTAASERGVSAQLFAGQPGNQAILFARVLRPGVWVDAARRFFPLTPPIPNLRGAWIDLAHRQTVTVALDVDDCRHDFCPIVDRTTVAIWPLAPAARPTAAWSTGGELMHGATVQIVDGGARAQVDDCKFTSCRSPWQRIDARGHRVDPDQRRLDAPTLEVDHRGSTLAVPAADLTIDGATLRVPGQPAIAIGKRHRLTAEHCVARDGDHALVTSTFDRCECDTGYQAAVLVHEITRVDLASGRVESLAVGKGAVAALRGPDGAVFVQVGGHVDRFASVADVGAAGTALPDGVVLMTPVGPQSNCCGL